MTPVTRIWVCALIAILATGVPALTFKLMVSILGLPDADAHGVFWRGALWVMMMMWCLMAFVQANTILTPSDERAHRSRF